MADSERVRGFSDEKTDRHTEICDSIVAFATENIFILPVVDNL